MTTKEADKYGEIAQALKQIEAETAARVNGMPLEDPQPTEAPADIDWTAVPGYSFCGVYTIGHMGQVQAYPGYLEALSRNKANG